MRIKLLILTILVLLAAPLLGYADEDFVPGSYLFFLYYDQGKLFANRDFVVPYDVVTAEYQEAAAGENYFRGEILSAKDKVLATFKFDPQSGNQSFKAGAITVSAPYFFNAQEANFYSNLGDKLATISVAEHSFCNDNGVCEEKEDQETCPADCTAATPSSSATPLPITNTVIFGLTLTQTLTWLGVIVTALAAVWLVFRWLARRRANIQNMQPPENVPPQQPQPPQI